MSMFQEHGETWPCLGTPAARLVKGNTYAGESTARNGNLRNDNAAGGLTFGYQTVVYSKIQSTVSIT